MNTLTASRYLSAFLLSLGRHAVATGLMSPEAQRILQGRRSFEEKKRARIKRGAHEYMIAREDPDIALHSDARALRLSAQSSA